MKKRTPSAKYLDLLRRAKLTRHLIATNPGMATMEIRAKLAPIKAPLMWLSLKGYIRYSSECFSSGGCWYARAMENFPNAKPMGVTPEAVADSERPQVRRDKGKEVLQETTQA